MVSDITNSATSISKLQFKTKTLKLKFILKKPDLYTLDDSQS